MTEVRITLDLKHARADIASIVRTLLKILGRRFGAKCVSVNWKDDECPDA